MLILNVLQISALCNQTQTKSQPPYAIK